MIRSMKHMALDVKTGKLDPEDINETVYSNYLDTWDPGP